MPYVLVCLVTALLLVALPKLALRKIQVNMVIGINPYTAGGKIGQHKMVRKTLLMTETLTNGYSFERTQRELSNEHQHDRVSMVFKKSLYSCALGESSLSIGRAYPPLFMISPLKLESSSGKYRLLLSYF